VTPDERERDEPRLPAAPVIQGRARVGGWPIAAALAVVAVILYEIRYALLPFVFAAAIGFVADPLIRATGRRLRLARWAAAALLYIALLALLGVSAYWVGGIAAVDAAHVIARAPEIARSLIAQAVGEQGVVVFGHSYSPDQLATALGETLSRLIGGDTFGPLAQSGVLLMFNTILLLVLIPYFMISGPRLANSAIWLLPPERRRSVRELLPKLVPVLRRYFVGIFVIVTYTATAAWIGFGPVFALQHAVLLAVTVGILELVPAAGPIASAAIVGLAAVQQTSLATAAGLMAFAIALRVSIDNLVGPLVLGQAARLHPVVVMASFVCGVMLFGIVGLLLAVPVAVCIKATLEHYYAEPIGTDE
jgi:predicted PurR-regulated permease PerM